MNTTILLICNDQNLYLLLKYSLLKFDYNLIIESNFDVALHRISVEYYQCVVMCSCEGDLENIKKIRSTSEVPLILIFDKYDKKIILNCFEEKMDDYFVKPLFFSEIAHKINRIIGRTTNILKKNKMVYKSLVLDYEAKVVLIENKKVDLTKTEFEVLYYLLLYKDRYLSRKNIYQIVWKQQFYNGDRCVDTHVCLLRRKLKMYSKYIIAKRNYGYAFDTTIDK